MSCEGNDMTLYMYTLVLMLILILTYTYINTYTLHTYIRTYVRTYRCVYICIHIHIVNQVSICHMVVANNMHHGSCPHRLPLHCQQAAMRAKLDGEEDACPVVQKPKDPQRSTWLIWVVGPY